MIVHELETTFRIQDYADSTWKGLPKMKEDIEVVIRAWVTPQEYRRLQEVLGTRESVELTEESRMLSGAEKALPQGVIEAEFIDEE